MGHFIQPYRVHSVPVSVLQQAEQRRIRRLLQKAHKTQVSWLMKQPKWIKNRQFSF
jgi:DnaJ-domain-containing protein 1